MDVVTRTRNTFVEFLCYEDSNDDSWETKSCPGDFFGNDITARADSTKQPKRPEAESAQCVIFLHIVSFRTYHKIFLAFKTFQMIEQL